MSYLLFEDVPSWRSARLAYWLSNLGFADSYAIRNSSHWEWFAVDLGRHGRDSRRVIDHWFNQEMQWLLASDDSGRLYVGAADGDLTIFDTDTGRRLGIVGRWQAPRLASQITLDSAEEQLYYLHANGQVMKMPLKDGLNGNHDWAGSPLLKQFPQIPTWYDWVSPSNRLWLAVHEDGAVSGWHLDGRAVQTWDPSTGNLLREIRLSDPAFAYSPLIDERFYALLDFGLPDRGSRDGTSRLRKRSSTSDCPPTSSRTT